MSGERPRGVHGVPAPAGVLFDVGNTLLQEIRFDLEAGIRAVLPHDVARALELAGRFRETIREAHSICQELRLSTWLRARVPELHHQTDEAIEDAVWSEVVTLVPSPGIHALLARPSEDGISMGAVSNASFSGRILLHELRRHGLGDAFRFVLSSGDLGRRKPDRAIFDEALSRLGTSAERTWYVGDTLEEDIQGARGVGLAAIWLHRGPVTVELPSGVRRVRDWPEFTRLYDSKREGRGLPRP